MWEKEELSSMCDLEARFNLLSSKIADLPPICIPSVAPQLPKTALFYRVTTSYIAPDVENSKFIINSDVQWRQVRSFSKPCAVCTLPLLDTTDAILEIECDHRFHRYCLPNVICVSEGRFICATCDPEMYKAYRSDVEKAALQPKQEDADCRGLSRDLLDEIQKRGASV